MALKLNPRQLVLRRDTATGLTLVGWAADMPVGRFEHLALIGESARHTAPDPGCDFYADWQAAVRQARQANSTLLEQQVRHNESRGWYQVPFGLVPGLQSAEADSVGNYAAAAMQLQYHLTHNCKQAWAVHQHGAIVHVRARYPKKQLDELTYQVWYHRQLKQLDELDGNLLEGDLKVCESGLWFAVS